MKDANDSKMSFMEFAEKIAGRKLYPWEKQLLEAIEKKPPDIDLILIPSRKIFFIRR